MRAFCGHGSMSTPSSNDEGGMTNPSTAEARALVDGLLRSGIDEVVLAPGSRNGPLSIALGQAAAAGRLRLHVRVDERSAAFLALGLAKRLAAPTAVVCTSGTAAAHFHAAAFEATEAGVPLLLLTADRPPSVRGKGANQTIDQHDIFGVAVLKSLVAPVATNQPDAHWRGLITDAVASAHGNASTAPGAVHINLPFAEPLVPGDGDASWVDGLPEVAARRPPAAVPRGNWSGIWPTGGATPRGVVITSDPAQAADVVAFAEALQWPILAEPGSGARLGACAILNYQQVVTDPALRADVVVTVGRFALSRTVGAYVRSAGRHVAAGRSTTDPLGTAALQLPRLPDVSKLKPADSGWLDAWRQADAFADDGPLLAAAAVTRAALATAAPGDLVWYGPSSVVRHAERVAPAFDDVVTSYMNRGANGIDGVVSSAMGAALAHQRLRPDTFAMALIGDLTFLHDVNGLLIEAQSAVPNIAFVVLDSNGGRIFETLEQGEPAYREVFARVYGTPHNRDIVAIAQGYGARTCVADGEHAIGQALADARAVGGITVIVVNVQE